VHLIDAEGGTVSREVFVSEAIFERELEQLFARAWLFIGHESQVPGPGDFFSSRMGTTDFSRQDIQDQSSWLDQLLGFEPATDAERKMATLGTAAYIAAGTTEQRANTVLGTPEGERRNLHLGTPEIPARADVVVASITGSDGADRLNGLFTGQTAREAFTDEGWTAAVGGPTGLPAADLLVALREETDR